jgi:phosphatidylglycerol:prolipoprotein diacylglycerol transferase
VRANDVVDFLGTHILKQAQWTSLIVFILLFPISYLVMRWHYARPVPVGETSLTYGIAQKPEDKTAEVDEEEATDQKDSAAGEEQVEDEPLATKTMDGDVVQIDDDKIQRTDDGEVAEEIPAPVKATDTTVNKQGDTPS